MPKKTRSLPSLRLRALKLVHKEIISLLFFLGTLSKCGWEKSQKVLEDNWASLHSVIIIWLKSLLPVRVVWHLLLKSLRNFSRIIYLDFKKRCKSSSSYSFAEEKVLCKKGLSVHFLYAFLSLVRWHEHKRNPLAHCFGSATIFAPFTFARPWITDGLPWFSFLGPFSLVIKVFTFH